VDKGYLLHPDAEKRVKVDEAKTERKGVPVTTHEITDLRFLDNNKKNFVIGFKPGNGNDNAHKKGGTNTDGDNGDGGGDDANGGK
jgi:hypothetical protein